MENEIEDIYKGYGALYNMYKHEPDSITRCKRMLQMCDIIQFSLDLIKKQLNERINGEDKIYTDNEETLRLFK